MNQDKLIKEFVIASGALVGCFFAVITIAIIIQLFDTTFETAMLVYLVIMVNWQISQHDSEGS